MLVLKFVGNNVLLGQIQGIRPITSHEPCSFNTAQWIDEIMSREFKWFEVDQFFLNGL